MNLHVCDLDKFIPPFIEFVRENFSGDLNRFYLMGDLDTYPCRPGPDLIYHQGRRLELRKLLYRMFYARRIILHGLLNDRITQLLALNPWLLRKCYWVIWGHDLYKGQLHERGLRQEPRKLARQLVLGRVGHLVTYVPGDVALARKWYGARGKFVECIMYPSNLYKELSVPRVQSTRKTVLVGNSAASSNNHLEIFDLLSARDLDGSRIVVPLSYGERDYAERIINEGRNRFGARFEPLIDFLPYEDYLRLLAEVDIAIFAHDRQQGMGNIITLLGLGKKVFMKPEVTSAQFLSSKGIKIFDVRKLDLSKMNPDDAQSNFHITSSYFNRTRLRNELAALCD